HAERQPKITVRAAILRPAGANLPAWLRLRVNDNGIGFDNRYRERIFAPFQRLHGRNEYEGSGIGLAIVRRIVERHGGKLSAHGETGQGAQFVVELPMSQPSPSAQNTIEEKST
ncbi:MAG TPA: ATP-binding protein, partial [Tahibacter sp.]|nr:ATP-binding protein [Tahibacter sp.]